MNLRSDQLRSIVREALDDAGDMAMDGIDEMVGELNAVNNALADYSSPRLSVAAANRLRAVGEIAARIAAKVAQIQRNI